MLSFLQGLSGGRVFKIKKTRQARVLSPDQPVVAAAHVSVASRDGRAILMDIRSGRYWGLDDVGTRIWELVLLHKTPSEISATIEEEYDAPAQQLRDDAARFLSSLLALGVIQQ
jgi:hypothetical protein